MEKESTYSPALRWSERSPDKENVLEENLFYTLLRQLNDRVDYICFALKNGRQHTLSANEITEMFYHPEKGIILFFSSGTVQIEGRNLDALFRHLQERRVKEVKEFAENPEMLFNANALLVQRITYESEKLVRASV